MSRPALSAWNGPRPKEAPSPKGTPWLLSPEVSCLRSRIEATSLIPTYAFPLGFAGGHDESPHWSSSQDAKLCGERAEHPNPGRSCESLSSHALGQGFARQRFTDQQHPHGDAVKRPSECGFAAATD